MKIYKASEKEIDQRLLLNRRQDIRGFCHNFDSEIPAGFYELQDKIRDGLDKEFRANFDDGVDRSHLKPWEMWMHTLFFFNPDEINSERIIIEMGKEILGDKLIGLILAYLEKCPSRYCVIGSVSEKLEGDNDYIGRFIINLDEIAVEESLADTWSKQVKFMEIENLQSQ
jgi:hypothetical protein